MKSILIVGSGALATVYATKLSYNPDCQLQMYCEWHAGIQAIQQKGITCFHNDTELKTKPLKATTDPDQIQPVDLILVLVKSWQTGNLVSQIQDKLKSNGVCLTLQNGLGNLQILQKNFSDERVIAGTTMVGAELLKPAIVRITFLGGMQISEHPANQWIIPLFQQSGFEISSNSDLESVLWGKLIINAVVNPLTVIFQSRNGVLIESEESLALIDAMIDEIMLLINAKGITLPYPDAHSQVRYAINKTAQNLSSMAQDWKRNVPTEIENITGAILQEAKKYNLTMPVNQTIYQLVTAGLAAKMSTIIDIQE
ncbi:MAG: 2-dehydropantoate 2-reductase [Anaerolineaceae bacterium]|nr:2-dehydropantoate 2-reductase [Anaerolineaceae bacterium]